MDDCLSFCSRGGGGCIVGWREISRRRDLYQRLAPILSKCPTVTAPASRADAITSYKRCGHGATVREKCRNHEAAALATPPAYDLRASQQHRRISEKRSKLSSQGDGRGSEGDEKTCRPCRICAGWTFGELSGLEMPVDFEVPAEGECTAELYVRSPLTKSDG